MSKKFTQLPPDSAPTITDILASVDLDSGFSKKVTLQDLITLFFANIPAGNGSPTTRFDEAFYDFVASGLVWSADSVGVNRNASMTAGVVYINGRRFTISAVTSRTFTASKDTYIDILDNLDGTSTLVYTEVSNGAASPSLASNSIRIGIIQTGATTIVSTGAINQGQTNKLIPNNGTVSYSVTDSLGNMICNRSPLPNVIGYREATTTQSIATGTATDLVSLQVTVNILIARRYKIKLYLPVGTSSTANNNAVLVRLLEGATQLSTSRTNIDGNKSEGPLIVEFIADLTAGAHTYKGNIDQDTADNINYTMSSTSIGFISVEEA